MSGWPEPVTLTGPHATLVPLAVEHHDALVAATRDGELWRLWYTAVPSPEGMAAEIERRLALAASGSMR
ncbi:MAG: N-acetyltransferase, partial [Rubrivivax sp.]|nr:N-acetyltransferase [Rubrivivax sp.]